jgi:hypothetical protein
MKVLFNAEGRRELQNREREQSGACSDQGLPRVSMTRSLTLAVLHRIPLRPPLRLCVELKIV